MAKGIKISCIKCNGPVQEYPLHVVTNKDFFKLLKLTTSSNGHYKTGMNI